MTNAYFAAVRGTIRRRGPRLLAPALLFLATACIPTVHGGHYRPAVTGQVTTHQGVQCGGTFGAGELLEVRGPSGVLVLARMRPADHGPFAGHLGGQVGIFAPAGTRVALGEGGLTLVRVDGGRRTEGPLAVDSVLSLDGRDEPWGYTGEGRWGRRNAAFTRTIDGGEEGRTTWFEFDAGPADPRPARVELTLPTITAGAEAWSPGAITFRHRAAQLGIAPLNC